MSFGGVQKLESEVGKKPGKKPYSKVGNLVALETCCKTNTENLVTKHRLGCGRERTFQKAAEAPGDGTPPTSAWAR